MICDYWNARIAYRTSVYELYTKPINRMCDYTTCCTYDDLRRTGTTLPGQARNQGSAVSTIPCYVDCVPFVPIHVTEFVLVGIVYAVKFSTTMCSTAVCQLYY